MNTDQYMCNMKVLVGLFLANDINFKIYIPSYMNHFNYYLSLSDDSDDSPQIRMGLRIFIKNSKRIEVFFNGLNYVIIYEENMKRNEPGTFAELDVFL